VESARAQTLRLRGLVRQRGLPWRRVMERRGGEALDAGVADRRHGDLGRRHADQVLVLCAGEAGRRRSDPHLEIGDVRAFGVVPDVFCDLGGVWWYPRRAGLSSGARGIAHRGSTSATARWQGTSRRACRYYSLPLLRLSPDIM